LWIFFLNTNNISLWCTCYDVFFTWTKFETLMYECMMKVPLFVIFFFHKSESCMYDYIRIYAWGMPSCILSPFTLYEAYFNWSPICCNTLRFMESFCFDFFLWKIFFGLISLLRNSFLFHCFLNTIWVTYMKLAKVLEVIRWGNWLRSCPNLIVKS